MRAYYESSEWLLRATLADREREVTSVLRITEAKGPSRGFRSGFAGRLARLALRLDREAAGRWLSEESPTSGTTLNVYVVAGFETLRRGITNLIERERSTNLVGEASSLEQMARDEGCLSADVLVIDADVVSRSGMSELYERLGEQISSLKMLFLGGRRDAGAIGFEDIPLLMRVETIGLIAQDGSGD